MNIWSQRRTQRRHVWQRSVNVVLLFSLIAMANSAKASGIEWYRSFEQGLAAAKQASKPILIDFTADWCKPCKEMEASFWSQSQIIEVSKKFVCVSLNFDPRRPEITPYNVNSIPAVVFTDSWGNRLAAKFGFGPGTANSLFQIMQAIPADFSPISESNAILARDKDNSLFGRCLKEIPNGQQVDTAFLGLLTAHINRKKIKEAEASLAQFRVNHPGSTAIQHAEQMLQQSRTANSNAK